MRESRRFATQKHSSFARQRHSLPAGQRKLRRSKTTREC